MANVKRYRFYPCGTKVVLINGNVQCVIYSISIRFDLIQYELTYFNGDFKKEWAVESEFVVDKSIVKQVGFLL